MSIMPTTHLGNALMLGVVIHHVASMGLSMSAGCLAKTETCISDLCQNTEPTAVTGTRCGDQGCQMKGLEVCNVSAKAVLERFPSLERCLCAWAEEEEDDDDEEQGGGGAALCRSLQALRTQCHREPAQRKGSGPADVDREASGGVVGVGGGGRSCLESIAVCLSDHACNRNLAPLLQVCGAGRCERTRCRDAARRLRGGLPAADADLLLMCECGPADTDCRRLAAMLHRGSCGEDRDVWSCQEGLNHCLGDRGCRKRLEDFLSGCWSAEHAPCGEDGDADEDCVWLMNPALLLSGEAGCRTAFLALAATPLQDSCTCAGLNAGERQRCDAVRNVFHNRSQFAGPWQTSGDSYKIFDVDESESEGNTFVTGHLLYGLICASLVIIVLSVTAGILCKSGVLRKTGQTQFEPPGKHVWLFSDVQTSVPL